MQFTAGKKNTPPYIEYIDHNKMIPPDKCAHSDNGMSQQVKISAIRTCLIRCSVKYFAAGRCRKTARFSRIARTASAGSP